VSADPKPIGGGGARNPASLANLQPGAGAWHPGASPNLRHGLRSRNPPPLTVDPIAREIEAAIADDLPIRDAAGGVPAADRFAVELAAIALLRVRRCAAFLELHGDEDGRGNLRPEFEAFGRAVEQAARMLDRLGCSPRARAALGVDVGRIQTFDLALAMAADAEAERREREAAGDG
jgi:hypothetical protein